MKNIAIIDLESQSASTSFGSIISIAGILVNPDLKEIDRFELNCRNKPGSVPDPYSLWVNKGFYQMRKSNKSHYQLMVDLHKIIKKWSPCIWIGWNSIGFDFIMIQKENYKSLFPAYTLNMNKLIFCQLQEVVSFFFQIQLIHLYLKKIILFLNWKI